MKFLTGHASPNLRITHRLRRCQVTPAGSMVLTESTLTLELTIPSALAGIESGFRSALAGIRQDCRNLKAGLGRAIRNAFTPNLAHFVGVA